MPGIGIIANPYSKLNKRSPQLLEQMSQIVGQFAIFKVSQSLEQIDEVIQDFKQKDVEIIAISGGDGSVSLVISAIIAIYGDRPRPKICILGGGTMNLLANQLKIKGTPLQVLKKLVEKKDTLDYANCTLGTLRVGKHYGFVYADQSSTSILEEFYRKKNGKKGAFWLAIRLLVSYAFSSHFYRYRVFSTPLSMHLQPAGRVECNALGVFAGTISRLPLGFRLLPLAQKYRNHFQLLAIACSKEKLLWYLPSIMLKRKEGSYSKSHSHCCTAADLDYQVAFRYTIDGEIFDSPSGKIRIEAGPELDFVCP